MTGAATIFTVWRQELPNLAGGLWLAVKLTGVSLAIGLPLGLLLAVMVRSKRRLIRAAGLVVVESGRGMPLLVLIYLVYYGLPQVHLTFTAFVAAFLTCAWTVGAYSSESFRASLEAVAVGQHEAAAAVGLPQVDAFRFVILPQAMRIAVPPVLNEAIMLFQGTSIMFAIALPEIMSRAYQDGSQSFEYLNIFLLAAALYSAISLPASLMTSRLEKRLGRHLPD